MVSPTAHTSLSEHAHTALAQRPKCPEYQESIRVYILLALAPNVQCTRIAFLQRLYIIPLHVTL